MPYSITTKDGITINNIPDDVAPDSPELKARVAKIRAGGGAAALEAPTAEKKDLGFFGSIAESVTGRERATQETQTLPDWATMPELNSFSVASLKTGLGTLLSNPQETVQVIQANFPGVKVRQDEKGNFLLQSSIDGKEYAIKPGFQVSDIPRAAGAALAFTPAGRATTIPGAVAAGAGTQAVIEATQAATGGKFDTGEVVTAGITGGAVPAVTKTVQAVRGARAAAKPAAAAKAAGAKAAMPVEEVVPAGAAPVSQPAAASAAPVVDAAAEVGELTRKASGKGFGSASARTKLAEMAQVNPEAKAAADRLGLELPFDVFSDNPQVRAAVGLTRSVAGSEAEAAWRTTVTNAIDKADDAIKQFDAAFVEGTVSPATVSEKVRTSLTNTRSALNAEATKLYDEVNAAVPKTSPIDFPKLKETLDTIVSEVGEDGLSTQEKRLMKMISSEGNTYGRLLREKNLIGQAVAGKESPYGNMEAGALKRLYAALSEDQLVNVAGLAGEEMRTKLRAANLIYAKERALGNRIVNAFGEELEGSIATKMRTAITGAAKGDVKEFNKLLKVVPEDLRKETLATALASVTRSARGAERGGFGFSEYAKIYQGLRANPQVYKTFVDTLGKDSANVMRDLYEVSKRITEARANVLTTGRANQAMVESLKAESIVGKVMESTLAKGVVTGVSAMGGGPMAAAGASVVTNALTQGNKDAVKAAGKMFASEEFQRLVTEAATQAEPSKAALRRLAMSKAFKEYADIIKMPKELNQREQWLLNAMQSQRQFEQEQ